MTKGTIVQISKFRLAVAGVITAAGFSILGALVAVVLPVQLGVVDTLVDFVDR